MGEKNAAHDIVWGDGSRLFELRLKLGLTQVEFWERVGVTQSGGSRYENGRRIPTPVRMLLKIVYEQAKVGR